MKWRSVRLVLVSHMALLLLSGCMMFYPNYERTRNVSREMPTISGLTVGEEYVTNRRLAFRTVSEGKIQVLTADEVESGTKVDGFLEAGTRLKAMRAVESKHLNLGTRFLLYCQVESGPQEGARFQVEEGDRFSEGVGQVSG